MQRRLAVLLGILFCAGALAAPPPAHTRASLLLSATSAKPGDIILAGVRLEMDKGWHTYWRNPSAGGVGKPTSIKWELPAGISANEIQWPLPEKIGDSNDVSYVYQNETVLLVPLRIASDAKIGSLELKARVSWLECEIACVPGKADVSATLEIAEEPKPSSDATRLETWRKKVPESQKLDARATWDSPAAGDTRQFSIQWNVPNDITHADFFPYASDEYEMNGDTDLTKSPGQLTLRKVVKKSEGNWPQQISGVLVAQTDGERKGFEVTLPMSSGARGSAQAATVASASNSDTPSQASASLPMMLFYAFLGGMILNLMPCVLPVIALKILGFVSQSKEAPGRARKLGLLYALGVLVSFLVLAAVVIGVKAAGHQAGWGMQFSNPHFVVIFTALVTLVALNLFGVFEVTLGGGVLNAAGGLASRHGAAGAFFNGVLATALATPCTAPFLSIALGFAFAQSASVIALMFATVAIGLALPYVVLSWHPAWLKFLPKPGAWMEKFKIAMGFPMLGTAIWLSKVGQENYGERAWWLGVFLVLLALAAWVFGEFVQRGHSRKGVAIGAVIALLALSYFWALESKLDWRNPIKSENVASDAPLKYAPKHYTWQRWSPEAVQAARDAGRVVIVDFTAWWCGTCNTTVKPALSHDSVVEQLRKANAVALLADNSDTPPEILSELEKHGRAGVPMVLVYPPGKDAIVVPDPGPLELIPSRYAAVIAQVLKNATP